MTRAGAAHDLRTRVHIHDNPPMAGASCQRGA